MHFLDLRKVISGPVIIQGSIFEDVPSFRGHTNTSFETASARANWNHNYMRLIFDTINAYMELDLASISTQNVSKWAFRACDASEDMTGVLNQHPPLVWHQPGVVICMGPMWAEWDAAAGVNYVFLMSPAGGWDGAGCSELCCRADWYSSGICQVLLGQREEHGPGGWGWGCGWQTGPDVSTASPLCLQTLSPLSDSLSVEDDARGGRKQCF